MYNSRNPDLPGGANILDGEVRFQHMCRKYQVGRCPNARDCGYLRLRAPSGDFATLTREARLAHEAAGQCTFSHLCGLCVGEHRLIDCPSRAAHRAMLLR